MRTFIPGLALARSFHAEIVKPRIGVPHVAALLGEGSDVLGFDQPRSTDQGKLTRIREMLAWYPRDVWLWAMASQWHLIGNAEPRIGRTVEAGDTLDSTLIAARLVRLLMELAFLQERRYWPYDKWFGIAFSPLATLPRLALIWMPFFLRATGMLEFGRTSMPCD